MPYRKGETGNPNGAPRGPRRQTVEVRELALQLFDRSYWRLKAERIRAGVEHPKIEQLLLAYAYGQPPREEPVTSAVIQLGPLEALQAALQAHQSETLALPDVQVTPSSDVPERATVASAPPPDLATPHQQVASQAAVPTPAQSLRVVAGRTAAVGSSRDDAQPHGERKADAVDQPAREAQNRQVRTDTEEQTT